MKRSITVATLLTAIFGLAQGQSTLTLQACYQRAETNYPLIRQRELIEQTRTYSVENASKAYLPQISIGGQATYQSEVTRIPVDMPGIEPLSKDQYRIFGEVSQTVYHGGLVSARKQIEEANAEMQEQELAVGLYEVQSRINELFFGILLLRDQIVQTELAAHDLRTGLRKVEASIANGTALRSAADVINAELLRLGQRKVEMESAATAYRRILGLFINEPIDEHTVLERPVFTEMPSGISRPELRLFETQKRTLVINDALLTAGRTPRIELFVQGGYGRPGLNMLENEFDFYYLGGIRLSWLLSGYYTLGRERQILDIRRRALDVRQETFLFNTNLMLTQHEAEIARLQRLIGVDDEIISLRTRVTETAEAQLEQGVIASTDFIREVNAEDQARQNRVLHETQLLLAQAKYRFTSGQ